MKIVEITIRFRCSNEVQDNDISNWMDDLLALTIDYDSFEDATGYTIKDLPEVIGCDSHIDLGNGEG